MDHDELQQWNWIKLMFDFGDLSKSKYLSVIMTNSFFFPFSLSLCQIVGGLVSILADDEVSWTDPWNKQDPTDQELCRRGGLMNDINFTVYHFQAFVIGLHTILSWLDVEEEEERIHCNSSSNSTGYIDHQLASKQAS
jgi:hypothetical protein